VGGGRNGDSGDCTEGEKRTLQDVQRLVESRVAESFLELLIGKVAGRVESRPLVPDEDSSPDSEHREADSAFGDVLSKSTSKHRTRLRVSRRAVGLEKGEIGKRRRTNPCTRQHVERTGVVSRLIALVGFKRQEVDEVLCWESPASDEVVSELDKQLHPWGPEEYRQSYPESSILGMRLTLRREGSWSRFGARTQVASSTEDWFEERLGEGREATACWKRDRRCSWTLIRSRRSSMPA
jgi:hypothetical protein